MSLTLKKQARFALLLLILGGICYCLVQQIRVHAQTASIFTSVTEVGRVGKANTIRTRDGGAMGYVGNRLFWTFGDTFYTPNSGVTLTPSDWRSATGAYADVNTPLSAVDQLDARGVPQQTIPYTAEELAYNKASNNPNERYALWPTSVITVDASQSLIFFTKLKTHPGELNFETLGTGVARIRAGSYVAERQNGLLFSGADPQFNNAFVRDGVIYIYDCEVVSLSSNPCKIARAPIAQATNRASYQGWNGKEWGDISKAIPVINGSTAGFSVSWNPHLHKYIAVAMPAFSNTLYYQLSDNPAGPWSNRVVLKTISPVISGGSGSAYTAYQHPELDVSGKSVYISYFQPEPNWLGQVHVIKAQIASSAGGNTPGATQTPTGTAAAKKQLSAQGSSPVVNAGSAVARSFTDAISGRSVRWGIVWGIIGVCFFSTGLYLVGNFVRSKRKQRLEQAHHFPDLPTDTTPEQ